MYTRLDNEQIATSLAALSDQIKKATFASDIQRRYDPQEGDHPIVAGQVEINRDLELIRLSEGMIFALCAGTRELRHVDSVDDKDDGSVTICFKAPS
jgi:hypothetical protein